MAAKFDKKKFPGLGTKAPKQKELTVEEAKELLAEEVKEKMKDFLGEPITPELTLKGQAVLVNILDDFNVFGKEEPSDPKDYYNPPDLMEYIPSEPKYIGEYKPPPVIKVPQKESDMGLSKVSAKSAKKSKPKKKKTANPIYQWAFTSNKEVAGMKAQYTTILREDRTLSCNCPGWVFAKAGVRSCKHTRQVEDDAKSLYKDWKAGKKLPSSQSHAQFESSVPGQTLISGSSIGFSRKMDI